MGNVRVCRRLQKADEINMGSRADAPEIYEPKMIPYRVTLGFVEKPRKKKP